VHKHEIGGREVPRARRSKPSLPLPLASSASRPPQRLLVSMRRSRRYLSAALRETRPRHHASVRAARAAAFHAKRPSGPAPCLIGPWKQEGARFARDWAWACSGSPWRDGLRGAAFGRYPAPRRTSPKGSCDITQPVSRLAFRPSEQPMRSSRSSGSLSPSDARSDPAQGERRDRRGEDGEGSYPTCLTAAPASRSTRRWWPLTPARCPARWPRRCCSCWPNTCWARSNVKPTRACMPATRACSPGARSWSSTRRLNDLSLVIPLLLHGGGSATHATMPHGKGHG
jgi:hypothetical protein